MVPTVCGPNISVDKLDRLLRDRLLDVCSLEEHVPVDVILNTIDTMEFDVILSVFISVIGEILSDEHFRELFKTLVLQEIISSMV